MICFLAAWHVVVHREATVESTVAAVTLGQLLVLLLLLMKISFKPVASFLSYRLGQSPLHHGPLIPSWRRDSNSANIVAVTIFFGHKSIFFFLTGNFLAQNEPTFFHWQWECWSVGVFMQIRQAKSFWIEIATIL